ncbi:MAG TPA: DUF4097 family beta strand repeat-containing protein [Vicinamibacterales bacterium]|nr:DUF4097 family beta strand repeat-containing protein [Vicinamibacterales bacterium]
MKSVFVAAGVAAVSAVVTLAASPVEQSTPRIVTDDEWCRDASRGRDRETHCEVREFTFATPGRLTITDSPNGAIRVTGSGRSDVQLRARVTAWARTIAEAQRIAGEVRLAVNRGTVDTAGPDGRDRDTGWSVSYRAETPRAIDLELDTSNGSIAVSDVGGTLDLSTSNGSLTLAGLSGRVEASTSNGSARVTLSGREWTGDGLDVSTGNGSVRVDVPDGYNARLVASTGNGSLRTDIPLSVTGRLGRSIDTTLGSGGSTVRLRSGNGSVRIGRAGSN